ncbi:antibiotic biosynthesis monooxygenase family protein [Actinomadura sp. 21ATH]|uniref:antibiotic biosynthesis monooxygenase family protein n=1 Tax=Actinomadura sp. 21ATH TaxID=1735444 RepID=UPI0035BFB0E4
MIAITRYRVPEQESAGFAESMTAVLDALAASPGYRAGRLARTVDDPGLWALVTEWDGAGYYRRALGAYDVRLRFIPLAALAVDEPGAYEIVTSRAAGQRPEKNP